MPDGMKSIDGATVVISHKLRNGAQDEYEKWIEKIMPIGVASPGYLDSYIVRPVAGLTETYTVIIRFDGKDHLRAWMESPVRKEMIGEVRHLLAGDDSYSINSGLDFLFVFSGGKSKTPVRWKQFLLTWSAIYPLSYGMSVFLRPVLGYLEIHDIRMLSSLIVTGFVVYLMVYVVMPRYTRLVQRWLFRD